MIKRICKLFVILILFIFPNIVFGEEWGHIYFVDEFTISGSTIKVGGYAYVSHRDNWGIKNGKGNLKNYIVAYTGDWNDSYINSDGTCKNNSNCYSIYMKPNNSDNRDFYYARCYKEGCNNTYKNRAYVRAENNAWDDGDDGDAYFKDSCINIEGTDGGKGVGYASNCLYNNVDFSGRINLETIFSKLNGANNVKFKIVSVINSANPVTMVSNLGVYNGICRVNDKKCSSQIVSGNYEFSLKGLGTSIIIDATRALARDSNGNNSGSQFVPGDVHSVLGVGNLITLSKGSYGQFKDRLIKLDSKYINGVIKPDNNGDDINDYYTITNHIRIYGDFVLEISSFKPRIKEIKCGDESGFISKNNNKTSSDVKCDDAAFSECISKIISSKVFIKTSADSPYLKELINGNYYIPIDVEASVLFNQDAKFAYGRLPTSDISAGKGFSFLENQNPKYLNNIKWKISKFWLGDNSPFYSYKYNGNDVSDYDFDFSTVYYKDTNNNFVSGDKNGISFKAIENKVKELILKNADKFNAIKYMSCDSNKSEKCDDLVEVGGFWKLVESSYKSNSYGGDIINNYEYSLFDSFVEVTGDKAGEVLYENTVNQSQIDKVNAIRTGKKYYINFKWNYNTDWPFNLNESNPSLVEGMNWNLKGRCSVPVKASYYYYDENNPNYKKKKFDLNIKYRSISLSNPFPKAGSNFDKIAVNWRDWYKNIGNQNRIKNTISPNKPLYSIIISKYNVDNAVSISNINSITTHYGSIEGIEKNGMSNFVDNNFNTKSNTESYCPLGKFIANVCDIKRWG